MSRSKCVLLITVSALTLVLAFSASARADWFDVPDPDWVAGLGPEWQIFRWHVESLNEADAYWESTELVPTGAGPHDYMAEFTIIEAQLAGAVWVNVTGTIGDTFSDGTEPSLPFDIINETFEEVGVLKVDIAHGVDATGLVYTSMTNADFGDYLGTPITGFRGAAVTAVSSIPEPGSTVLLASGALVGLLFWRRRQRLRFAR
jgi:hypothetical protein